MSYDVIISSLSEDICEGAITQNDEISRILCYDKESSIENTLIILFMLHGNKYSMIKDAVAPNDSMFKKEAHKVLDFKKKRKIKITKTNAYFKRKKKTPPVFKEEDDGDEIA